MKFSYKAKTSKSTIWRVQYIKKNVKAATPGSVGTDFANFQLLFYFKNINPYTVQSKIIED